MSAGGSGDCGASCAVAWAVLAPRWELLSPPLSPSPPHVCKMWMVLDLQSPKLILSLLGHGCGVRAGISEAQGSLDRLASGGSRLPGFPCRRGAGLQRGGHRGQDVALLGLTQSSPLGPHSHKIPQLLLGQSAER